MMSRKFLNAGAGVCAALFAVTVLAWDQDPIRDDSGDDLTSPWCRIDSPDSWEGRPCVVPLRIWSAEGTAIPR
jgi:hypothetical protein